MTNSTLKIDSIYKKGHQNDDLFGCMMGFESRNAQNFQFCQHFEDPRKTYNSCQQELLFFGTHDPI
jgi:hypothetical protein